MAKKKNKSPAAGDATESSIPPSMPPALESSKPKVNTPLPQQQQQQQPQPSTSALIICRNKYVPALSGSDLVLFQCRKLVCCVYGRSRRMLMLGG